MTFAQAVDELHGRSGVRVRRREWATWRWLYVSRGSSEISSGALVVTLKDKQPGALPEAWGVSRWRPLLRDVTAADWEVLTEGR